MHLCTHFKVIFMSLFCLLVSDLALAGERLEFREMDLVADITWLQGPTRGNQENRLRIDWFQSGTADIRVALNQRSLQIQPWMPTHNHGGRFAALNPLRDSANQQVPGAFEASRIFFSMSHGAYVLRITVTDSEGKSQVVDLPLAI